MQPLEQDHNKYLSQGAILMLGTFFLGFVLTYTFNVFLARLMGPNGYGNYKVAEAFIMLGSLVAAMGGTKAAARFLPEHIRSGDRAGVWEYTRFYLKTICLISLVLALVVYVGHQIHFAVFDGKNYHPLLFAAFVIPLSAATALLSGILQVARHLHLAYMPWRFGYPGLRLALCAGWFFVFGSLNAEQAVLITLVVVFMLLMVTAYNVRRMSLMPIRRLETVSQPRNWLLVSTPMMVIVALQTMMRQVDIYMIEAMAGEIEVGHFAAAQTTANAVSTVQFALIGLLTPLLRDAVKNGPLAVRALNRRGFSMMAKGVIPTTLVVCLFGHSILQVFDHDTELAYEALVTLSCGYAIGAMGSMSILWLQYTDAAKVVVRALVTSVVLNAVLNAVLIPLWNIEGASLATAIAIIAATALYARNLRSRLGIYPWSASPK